jgi:hypothetical protein
MPGMPVWNSPAAGSGVVLSGDYGHSDSPGAGSSYAVRGNVGVRRVNLGISLGSPDPAASQNSTGGTMALRLAGGGISPLAINVQGGYAAGEDEISSRSRATLAFGLSLRPPLPGFSLEPWISPGLRMDHRPSGSPVDDGTDVRMGVAAGVNARFGLFGVHAAVDHEKAGGDRGITVVGIGVHLALGIPVGS